MTAPDTGPSSAHWRVSQSTRAGRFGLLVWAALLAAAAALPWWADASYMRLATEFACLLVLAQMWNLLAGYGGMVSVGQQGYLGIGGYALIALADYGGINPFACVLLAGGVAAAVSVPTAALVFRLQGGHFAIGTWVVAEVFRLVASNTAALGGGSGRSLQAMREFARALREPLTYWIGLAVAAASVTGVYLLMRSRLGLALAALRDSEVAAESQGVNVRFTKVLVYVLSALGCGVAGALYFLMNLRISPDAAFTVGWSAAIIFIVVIGGIGTIEGPIIGTLLYFALRETLADFGTWYLIALGIVAIVAMVRFPKGIWGTLAERYGLYLFPVQRRVVRDP
ncbi:MAG: branched-chain amino acid ABC transporter permease [Burkholderiales bacterium]|nr:branched-chain amino acid ABC transporter permease [Burkholderiales bacterium]